MPFWWNLIFLNDDFLLGVKELDFEEFAPQLTEFIEEHRKNEKKKKALKKSEEEAKASAKHDRDDDQSQEDEAETESPMKKRQKTSGVPETPADEDVLENDEGADDNDGEESLADASQDDGESQSMEQDENESTE